MTTPRICAVRDGQAVPLFTKASLAPPSPSSTMLIERHLLTSADWVNQRLPAHVLTMFLDPGEMLHSPNGGPVNKHTFRANDVAMCMREREEAVHWSGTAEVLSVSIEHHVVMRVAQELTASGRFEVLPGPTESDARLVAMLKLLYMEQASGYAAGRLFVDGIEQAIAALLVTRRNALSNAVAPAQVSLPPHTMKRVREFIDAHLDAPLHLAALADCAGISEGHFSRLFRSSFRATPHQFVLQTRIDRAKALLAKSRHSVIDIGLQCGFPNPQHFSRIFHRLVGMPPSQFRRAST